MSKIVKNTGKFQDDQEEYSGGGGSGVTSFNSRTGTVTPQSGDYDTSLISTSINGLVKGNGSALSAASSGTDYAPATSGTAILKGNGSGGFSSAASGTDYAPATSGSAILKGNGSGGFSSAASGTDYAPATSGTAILKGNGSGGFSSAASGTDYAPATSGTSLLKGNGSGGFSNAVSGTDYAPATSGTGILRGDGSGGFTSGAAFANLTDFTAWTDYSATTTIVGLTSLTTKKMQYMIMAKTMFIFIDFRCASPNSSGSTTTFTIPNNASSWAGEQRGLIHGVNGTTQAVCLWKIASGSNIIEVANAANDTSFSGWTNGVARRIEGFLMINIA